MASGHRRFGVVTLAKRWEGDGLRGLVATESGPSFEVPEFPLVVRGSVEGTTPALGLCVLDSIELVGTGVLEVAPVWFCRGRGVSPACYSGLVDGLEDLAVPPRLGTPTGNLSPWGRYVGDVCELGSEGVNGFVDPSR